MMLRNPNYFMNNTSETLAVHVLKFIKLGGPPPKDVGRLEVLIGAKLSKSSDLV